MMFEGRITFSSATRYVQMMKRVITTQERELAYICGYEKGQS